ncbi:NADPH:quinone oxidoreductase family protein [Pelagibius sp. Alg239-R121]|uniref:NADPH:quinone oxidoreductase family protein n=1 Tax=Pelagibius sp. Alg239-R121 TaxID=2993448 RepID=UPI0024A637E0|nr:NADPH:quinone oxidoreductase family protein [Pelagibius sp. Alg239-R121]
MRAVLCNRFGPADELVVGEPALPELAPDEVRIALHAAGVNFADTLMIAGKYQEKPPFPFSPGLEGAGVVEAVGADITSTKAGGIAVGQRVLCLTDHGAFADTAIAKASDVHPIPDSMDYATAAGFPITYGTAHGALTWQARMQAGETLLVHGAAGGVGLAAVEVGKALGATVIATAGGAEKLEVARKHGADYLIDYRSEDIRARVKELTNGRGADVVFDPVGGDVFDATLRCTAWSGRIVVIGFAGGRVPQIPANHLLVKNIAALGFYWGSYRKHAPDMVREEFVELLQWFEAGKLSPLVSHQYDLTDTAAAMELLTTRKSTGKVVLTTGRS